MKVRVAEAGNYNITLVNMVGQEVFRTNTQAMAQDVIEVNANDLPKGIYLVNVTLNGNTTVEKVTIK